MTAGETTDESSSTGLGDSSSSGFFDEPVYVYATDVTFNGNLEEQAAGDSLVDFVDEQCIEATAAIMLDCTSAAAVMRLPGFTILDALPEGEYLSVSSDVIADSRDDFFLGMHSESLIMAGSFPAENPRFWTGVGEGGQDCMGWSAAGASGWSGDAASTGTEWLSESLTSCESELPLLCICVTD